MRLGICTGFEHVPTLKPLGYDYIEGDLTELSCLDASQIAKTDAMLRANRLFMETANHFFPPEIRLCGEEMDFTKIREYTRKEFDYAVRLGLELAVLGSGASRQIPVGYDRQKAHEELLATLYEVGNVAREYGVLIAVEPLNREECNHLNTVSEAVAFVEELNHPNVHVVADLYHMEMEGEPFSALLAAGNHLCHIHFNRPVKPRSFPSRKDGYNYTAFARALRQSGYTGRVSIEAGSENFAAEADASLSLMWQMFRGSV